ncbi:MAG: hypothetical protein MUF10_10745 [Thermoanaerobaculaceae bacterium]|nr:hypothetical protein [Thermoanaerobaculaceae bacterium]
MQTWLASGTNQVGALSVGTMDLPGTSLRVTHATGLEWHDPRVRVVEAATAKAWNALPADAQGQIEQHFRAQGGLKLYLVDGIAGPAGPSINGQSRPGGDYVMVDVNAACRQTPRYLGFLFLHEVTHCLGEATEAGADALAASWGWPREVDG